VDGTLIEAWTPVLAGPPDSQMQAKGETKAPSRLPHLRDILSIGLVQNTGQVRRSPLRQRLTIWCA